MLHQNEIRKEWNWLSNDTNFATLTLTSFFLTGISIKHNIWNTLCYIWNGLQKWKDKVSWVQSSIILLGVLFKKCPVEISFFLCKESFFLVLFSSNPQIRCWSEGVTRWNPHDPTKAYTPGDGILPSTVSLCLFFHLHKGICNVLNSHLNGISWTQHTMHNSITSVPKMYKLQKNNIMYLYITN